ncbi:MAG TPA: hypothetical protein V6D12_01285, partial [Candidatus Obscuribacterales bacterium]
LVTPILLNLTCSVFQSKSTFPAKRSDLYKQGLELLLMRWDEGKGIIRDEIYHNLSLSQKLKMLSQIAIQTFENGDYFFEKSTVQEHIRYFLGTLPNSSSDMDALQVDSEAVLKSIEMQHGLLVERSWGIYSFSHLTFQEYLTARNIVASNDRQTLSKNLKNLVRHINEPAWREVFLLTAGLLGNADELIQLMKQQVDQIMAKDEKLQQFLIWLEQKSLSIQVSYKPAATRAFYLTLTLGRDLNLAVALDLSLAGNLAPELNLDLALERVLKLSLAVSDNPTPDRFIALIFALPTHYDFADNNLERQGKRSPLGELLQKLKKQLPSPNQGSESLKAWWNANGQSWAQQLRTATIRYRNIGHSWQLSDRQQESLRQYYEANQFLLDCLNSNCHVSPGVRNHIEETLLLPTDETV